MRILRKLIRESIIEPVSEAIWPLNMRRTDAKQVRDEGPKFYRYPSPASEPTTIESAQREFLDYRIGYSNSIHNIRYEEVDIVSKRQEETLFNIGPATTPEEYRKSSFISC